MLFKTLKTYGTEFLPNSILFILFVFIYGLAYANPVGFVSWMILLSIYSLIVTSLYYLINGFITLSVNL